MVRIEKQGAVWTVIHSRFAQARNAMDPISNEGASGAASFSGGKGRHGDFAAI